MRPQAPGHRPVPSRPVELEASEVWQPRQQLPHLLPGVLEVYWEPVLGQLAGLQWPAFTPYRPTHSQKA